MANKDHVDLLKQGADVWNAWRKDHPKVEPDLSDIDFEHDVHSYQHLYDIPHFIRLDLSRANLRRITARNSVFEECVLDGATITWSDLCYTHFQKCSMEGVELSLSRIGSAVFNECNLDRASLSYCSAEETRFTGSTLRGANLSKMSLIAADFSDAHLERTRVYRISAWDLKTEGAIQKDLIITDLFEHQVLVGSIEIAQFIYVLLSNPKIRDIIDTVTSKVVLILGRFTKDRKQILDALRDQLQIRGFVPVLFDFASPKSRDLTETISTLAHLSRFVVADLTSPRSIPHELASTVPHLPSVSFQPIIEAGRGTYGMFEHLQAYPWVKEVIEHNPDDLSELASLVISRCASQ